PGFVIVAPDLTMANRRAERSAAGMTYGEQSDFVVEIDEALHDHPPLARAAALLGIVPGGAQVGVGLQHALALAGGAHDRLDHAGVANSTHGLGIGIKGIGE